MTTRTISLLQPRRLTFGVGCLRDGLEYIAALPEPRVHILSSPSQSAIVQNVSAHVAFKPLNTMASTATF
jgi:hypothetical protein